jgi:hypothetical protein
MTLTEATLTDTLRLFQHISTQEEFPSQDGKRRLSTPPNGTVEGIAPVIISASRATDISDFYPDWFMHRLRAGYVRWISRING